MISIFYDNKIKKEKYEKLSKGIEVFFKLESLCKEAGEDENVFTKSKLESLLSKNKFLFKKVLYLDLFLREGEFLKKTKILTKDFLSLFDAVRVEDIGLALYLKEKFPQIKLQIILENFCHSKNAIKTIYEKFLPNVEKVAISSELEKESVKQIIKEKIETEILAFGNILIFQSPRNLLGLKGDEKKESLLTSKEIEDKKNIIYKANKNGNFIFYPEPLNILKDISTLKKEGIKNFRIDNRFLSKKENDELISFLLEKKDIKFSKYPYNPLFFYNNDSDKLFKNLKKKSFTTLPKAEVLSTISGKWATIYVYKDFSTKDEVHYKTQEGAEEKASIEAYDMEDKAQTQLKKDNVYYIKWQRKIFAGSQII